MGFRNVDTSSSLLIDHNNTHVAGMVSQLASAIKGRDVIVNAPKLKVIAAEVLKINPFAFDNVVRELAELELVRDVRYSSGQVASFSEQIPLSYDDIHERVGQSLHSKSRTELEEQLLVAVDALARSPLSATDLFDETGVDFLGDSRLYRLAESAELIRQFRLRDGTRVASSPLYAFEKPDNLVSLFEGHTTEEVRQAFGKIRERPGLPVYLDGSNRIVEDMIRLGLVYAQSVVGADRRERAFATMPYALANEYLTTKKQILEKALALIACVRCGQISGGATSIRDPDRLLAALADPDRNYTLAGHSSTQRQYAALIRLGVVVAVPVGQFFAARLVVTPSNQDNIEAVKLARILLNRRGEGIPERGSEPEASKLLLAAEDYRSPFETISLARKKSLGLSAEDLGEAMREFMGW